MAHKEFEETCKEAENMHEQYPYLRKGQCLYNAFAAHLAKEEWFNSITATDIDPFYDDDKIELFLNEIKNHVKD